MPSKPLKMGMMPAPPGDFVREEILEPFGLNISKAAELLKVRRPTLSDVCNGKARLTPDLALRLEKAFGVSMELLLRMQASYEAAKARQSADAVDVERYRPA